MKPNSQRAPAAKAAVGDRKAVGVLGKSLAVTAALAAIGSFALFFSGNIPWLSAKSGDLITRQEATARETAFATQPVLELSLVSEGDVQSAVNQMGLAPKEKEAVLNTLHVPAPTNAVAAPTKPIEAAATPAVAEPDRVRLAWVTLWDTDAEDGDAVRIDSRGFSRTVTLSKQPLTIAVPVPLDSVIKVTGIRDGEGGGITVGFASGATRAVFPIMSVGQTLGLRVQVNR